MNFSEIKVYIAAPFFNREQLEMVDGIEKILDKNGIDYFSPRSEGVIKTMTPDERKVHMKNIYDSNILNMTECNVMIAVIDDYDTGTVFELGYFTSMKCDIREERRIITITGRGYDLNVMLKFGTDCHLKSLDGLENLALGLKAFGVLDKVFEHWDIKPEVTT